jgi:hypothetical protein
MWTDDNLTQQLLCARRHVLHHDGGFLDVVVHSSAEFMRDSHLVISTESLSSCKDVKDFSMTAI